LAAALSLLDAMSVNSASLPAVTPAAGVRRRRAGILEGCVNRWVFGNVNAASARLLSHSGCEVVAPADQGCCGALHLHSGDLAGARRLARVNIAAFERAGPLDAIVVTAAGCGAAMKEYASLFHGDEAWEARAAAFAAKSRDALELIAEAGPPLPRRAVPLALAYHDACHLAHAQGVRSAPRELLASVPGLTLIPLAESDRCCGSAGIYNVLQPETANLILDRKIERLRESGADAVAAANPGCLLQIATGARRAGLGLRVAHPLEILDEATRP
jgi:glycolate oxidase iron-sulfur subunit